MEKIYLQFFITEQIVYGSRVWRICYVGKVIREKKIDFPSRLRARQKRIACKLFFHSYIDNFFVSLYMCIL